MSTLTTHFNLEKPDVGADDDVWGTMINAAFDIIDAKLKALELPVGALYLSTTATNPATSLGYGTWVAYAAGRALVGVGSNGEQTWAAAEERGSETHTLTEAQLPSHTHAAGTLAADSAGDHTHSDTFAVATASLSGTIDVPRSNLGDDNPISAGGVFSISNSPSSRNKLENNTSSSAGKRITMSANHSHTLTGSISSGGAHIHTISGATAAVGSGQAHNNVQPSIGVYVWRRTA